MPELAKSSSLELGTLSQGFLRRAPFYYLMIVNAVALQLVPLTAPSTDRRFQLEVYALLVGSQTLLVGLAILGARLLHGGIGRIFRHPASLALAAFLVTCMVATIAGIARENPIGYLMGDVYRFGLTGTVFLLAIARLKARDCLPILKFAAFSLTLATLVELFTLLGKTGPQFIRNTNPFWPNHLFLIVALPLLLLYARSLSARLMCSVGLVAALGATWFGIGRTEWLLSGLAIAAILLLECRRRPLLLAFLMTVTGTGIITLLIWYPALGSSDATTTVQGAWQQFSVRMQGFLDDPLSDRSIASRLDEMRIVTDRLLDDPIALAVGFGQGATYPIPQESTERRLLLHGYTGRVHQIHNLPLAIAFRIGLPGLLFWLLFLILALRCASQLSRKKEVGLRVVGRVALIYLSAMFVVSMFFSYILGEFVSSLMLGLVVASSEGLTPRFRLYHRIRIA